MRRSKKRIIVIVVSVLLAALLIAGGLFFAMKKLNSRPVEVYSMDGVSTTYWGGDYYSSGIVESSHNQMVYPDFDMEIEEVLVSEGDEVKAGDPVLKYVTTKLDIELEKALLAVEETNHHYDEAVKKLDHYKKLSPYYPPVIPDPPAPEPLKESEAECYEMVDETSVPFAGTGTEEDPYRYLCSYGFTVDPDFMAKIMGISTPSEEEEMEEPAPLEPFAVSFEVHEEDNENGLILSGIFMNGMTKEMAQLTEEFPEIEEEEIIVIPPPPAEAYSKEELEALVSEYEKKVSDLEYEKKTTALAVTAAERAISEATVYAKEDGYISKLRDEKDARAEGTPMIVISGGKGAFIRGSINEGLLEMITEGNIVMCNNWMTGEVLEAEIVEVSPYPSENDMGWGSSSGISMTSYDFLAFIPEAGNLQEGDWLDITLSEGQTSDSLYIISAFIENTEDGKFVWKVSEEGTLTRIPVTTGKSLWGEYVEVFGNLSMMDSVAFPGSKGVREGASVKPAEY